MNATETKPASPAPKRRWFQYSLRTLLLFVLLCSLACSWFAVKLQKARRQREAVEAITRLDGNVKYDYELDAAGQPLPGATRPAPTWLRNLFGDDLFDSVVEANFVVASDAALEHVEQLPSLQSLNLGCSDQVTDAGLAHLRGLSQLRRLWFGMEPHVTDAGLVHLSALRRLERLDLTHLDITDEGLEHLLGLTQLQELRVSGTGVTDSGLQHLKGLKQLERLNLYRTRVTAAGVKELQQALPDCEIRGVKR